MGAALLCSAVAIVSLYRIGGPAIRMAGLTVGVLTIAAGAGQFVGFAYLAIEYSINDWIFILWGSVAIVAGILTILSIRSKRTGRITPQQDFDTQ